MNMLRLDDDVHTGDRSGVVSDAIDLVHRRMHRWRSNSQALNGLLKQVFGRSGRVELAGITVQCLDALEMTGLRGAYAAKSQVRDETIYLNNDWLATASTPEIESVLLEEIGHAIDIRLNGTNDSDGDEGAVFSAMIRGVDRPKMELNQKDQYLLEIDTVSVAVEASAPGLSGAAVLGTIAEDSTNSSGNTIANLLSSAFSSDSGRRLEAIAITANRADASTEGVWQYSLAPHLDWLTVPTTGLADSSALYLTGATKLRFVPNSGFVGQPGEISVRLVDQSFVADEDISFGMVSVNPFGLSQLDGTSDITPAFADLDADGDVDGFIGGDRSDSNGVFDMYLNTGTPSRPSFSAGIANAFQILDSRSGFGDFRPTFVDIDSDGDLDLFAANESNKVIDYYENQGSPTSPDFAEAVGNPFGLVAPDGEGISIKFADIDNDGDLDVVIGGDVGPGYAFNIGTSESPQFEDIFHLMYKWNYQDISGGMVFPEFVDLDNNGVLDMFATHGFNSDGDIAYFKNLSTTSTPDFAPVSYNPFGISPGITFAAPEKFPSITQFVDLNNDGLMDLLMGSQDGGNIGYFPNTSSQSGATVDVSNDDDNSAVSSQMVDLTTAVARRDSDVDLVLQEDHSFYVDSEAKSGLWLDLNVLASNAARQNNLVLIDQTGQTIATVGATQFSNNLGRESVFVPGGSTISFQQSSDEKSINDTPRLKISEQSKNAFKIQLEDGLDDDDHDDLIVELIPRSVTDRMDATSMAIHQRERNDSIVDLHPSANAGKTVEITLKSDSDFRNRFGLVELAMGNDGGFTVDGLTSAAGGAFDQAVRDRLINPGGDVISTAGDGQQVIRWTLSGLDAGYYAPVLINPFGTVLTYGSGHVKNLGLNHFCFEDSGQIQSPDWDFNDLVVSFDVI